MNNQTNFIIKVWVIAGCFFFSGLPVIYALSTISSFYPASGPVGTLVTVTGTGLSNPSSFTIGGIPAIVVSNNGTSLVGMVMPGAVTGNISVTTPGGTATSGPNFTITATPYPSRQQGTKLTGTDAISPSYQGWSVSLNADCNTAIVGGPYDNSNIGAAWVYTRSGNSWIQQGPKLVGTGAIGAAKQGISVSLSADGNTAIVGGSNDNSGVGAAWVYTRSGNTWVQQGSKLTGTGAIGYAYQGRSVSLSADGNTAIIGGPSDNADVGATWVFTRNVNTWAQQGSKLTGTGAIGPSNQGQSVFLSADGNTAIFGGYQDNNYAGAAWIYTRNGNTWAQQGSKLIGTGANGIAQQGSSVSLSADGYTAIVGGTDDNSGIGAAWVFTRSGNTWAQQGSKLVGTSASGVAGQGVSVSLSADGNTAIVGGPGDNSGIGAAWVYTRSEGIWSQQGSKLVGTETTGQSLQGTSVSLSADGHTAIVGGFRDNSNAGAAWVFIPPPPDITAFSPDLGPPGTLVTITGNGLSNLTSFSIGGTPAIVVSSTGTSLVGMVMPGAITDKVSITTTEGIAKSRSDFTIVRTPYPSMQLGGKLTGISAIGKSKQGNSVSVSADGNTAIVGGPEDNSGVGAAWVYTRSGNSWIQQGSKLVGTGAVGQSKQGYSVSLSADGNTAIVGGPEDNPGVGAAWVYTRSGNSWIQQGSKLTGTGAIGQSKQGYSVSLSADGNTAIVGGNGDNNNVGAAWIYTRNGNTWAQQGSKLTGTGATGNANQGKSVSLSADGNTVIVGGSNDNSGVGAAWVYTRSGNTWTQQGNKFLGTGATGNAHQGESVSLSANGNTAIMGGPDDNDQLGAAWVFTRSGNVWTQQGSKLVGNDALPLTLHGCSVSLSADGNTAIIGGYLDNYNAGAAWVYTRNGNTWAQQGSKFVGTGATGNAYQGTSVSLSADGKTAIVGGLYDNFNIGAAWVLISIPAIVTFSPESGPVGTLVTITGNGLSNPASFSIGGTPAIVISNSSTSLVGMVMPGVVSGKVSLTTPGGTATSVANFTVTATPYPSMQQGDKLTGISAIGKSKQGNSVSVSADGNTAIVGGPEDNSGVGAAWVYTRSGGNWTQQESKLVGTGAIGAAQQGSSVSLSADGNTAIVGGPYDNSNKGAAWVFTRIEGLWLQQGSKLVGTGATGNAYQGKSVSLSADGNTAIVGGPDDNSKKGAAWVYTRTGGIWSQQGNKLVGTGANGNAYQGKSVSLSADGNTAIVGGPDDNSNIGAAWVYKRSGNTWAQQGSKLIGNDASYQPSQGSSVSLSADGSTAIVGGPADNYSSFVGAAWVYTRSGNVWTQQGSKLVGTDALPLSLHGYSVSLSADGNTAIVGGIGDNSSVGAIWVYTRSGNTWIQQGSKLTGNDATFNAQQGYCVSLSADGTTAIVGGNGDNSNAGAAWILIVRPPTGITSFSPESGPAGTLVTVTGKGLSNPTSLTIGGIPAIVLSNTSTSVVGMVMPGAVTSNVSLTTPGGTATSATNFTVTPTPYPSVQQGDKLVGTAAIGASQQGSSVSLSADGNTAIVGGPYDNSNIGAAWVYTRSGNTWAKQGGKLVGTDAIGAAQQGSSVSLSADGNTAIVGGPHDNSGAGAAWVYTRSGGIWSQQGSKLVGTGATGLSLYGTSVSLSADGNTAIVGGTYDNYFVGAAWVYTRIRNTWTHQGNKLVGTGATGNTLQGQSVSLSADGNTAIVGGYGDNSGIGAAWVYTRSGSTWTQQGSKLVGTGASGGADQIISVSLSADGNTAIVGESGDYSFNPDAWVFTRSGNAWTQQGSKLTVTGATGLPLDGKTVSLSADGNTAIMGVYYDNSEFGAAWVYTRSGDTWTQHGSKLNGTGSIGKAGQGASVSLSADGSTAILGGCYDNSSTGAAWVFKEAVVGNPLIASVSVEADPAGSVCAGTPVTFTATPVNGGTPSYQWMKGGVAIPGETGPIYTSASLAATDTITVVMSSSLSNITGNPATSNAITVTFKSPSLCETGIESLSDRQKFDVYPVPSEGLLKVTINSPVSDTYSIQVCNSIGVKLYEKKEIRVNGLTETNIDLRQATQGLYYIVFRSNQQQIVRKIIISR